MARMTKDEIKLRRFLADYYKRCLEKSPEDNMATMSKAAGMAESTLNRFLSAPLVKPLPRTDTLLKLYIHSGVQIFTGFEAVAWMLDNDVRNKVA